VDLFETLRELGGDRLSRYRIYDPREIEYLSMGKIRGIAFMHEGGGQCLRLGGIRVKTYRTFAPGKETPPCGRQGV